MRQLMLVGILLLISACTVDRFDYRYGKVTYDEEQNMYYQKAATGFIFHYHPACNGQCLEDAKKAHK